MLRISHFLMAVAVGGGLLFGSASALAAVPAKAPATKAAGASADDKAQVEDAMLYLKVFIGGLQSDKVEQPIKGVLVGCLYNNSLGKISESMDKVIAENPTKIHRDNPAELLSAMVQICGYRPPAGASTTTPKGR